MSNFIEINQGIFIKSDCIEAIVDTEFDEQSPEIVCKVYAANDTFPSVLPSNVILEMIGVKEESKSEYPNDDTQNKILNIMKQQSTFAG